MDILKEVSTLLIDAHNKLLSTKTASGLPELKGQELQYKTLQKLSKPPTFRGKFLLTKCNLFLCMTCDIFGTFQFSLNRLQYRTISEKENNEEEECWRLDGFAKYEQYNKRDEDVE